MINRIDDKFDSSFQHFQIHETAPYPTKRWWNNTFIFQKIIAYFKMSNYTKTVPL